ncbi:MAG: bifunctional oligoribonuclease/PAP phosphatase NrnA [Verrucomicrobiales bacterium]|nr:bifunctional oligoribonuclease/PAP phosphatase NrnA [Verrucomicrobiales bacterium]
MSSSLRIIRQVLAALETPRNVCIVGHVRPDGDCIGSQLALAHALKRAGKRVTVWNADPIPAKLAFLDPDGLLQRPARRRRFDCVIATDAANPERLGETGACIGSRRQLINIDHHQSNTRYGDVNWVEPASPSTGELIHQLCRRAGWAITPLMADLLFTAVSTDTGSFQYDSVRPGTFTTAADLVRGGVRVGELCRRLYQSQSRARVELLRHVYQSFKLSPDGCLAWFWLRPRDLARAGADRSDTDGLIDHIRSIDTVVAACVFEELEDGRVRVSLRSKSRSVDVNRVAARFGGGGHPAAAGARLSGPPASAQRRVLSALREALECPF